MTPRRARRGPSESVRAGSEPPATVAAREEVLASIPCPRLREAGERVLAAWRARTGERDADEEPIAELVRIGCAVCRIREGKSPQPELHAGSLLRKRVLLARLRDELLDPPDDGARLDAAEEDAYRRAFEQLRAALEPAGADGLEAHLVGPQALELVAEIAHDLRSPLTSILTLAETLRRGGSGEVNELQRRQLGLIYSAALALSTTASDVLELTHGKDRLAQSEPTAFSIAEILASIHDIVYPMAEEKGVSLRFVPNPTDRRLGYPVALSRVLLNLTANAIKFTEEGFVEIAARSRGATEVEFSVRDTGKGIKAGAIATLYQPFRRAPGRRGYCFSGTGLGLAICRRLVAAMRSELRFDTGAGLGTRFYFQVELPPAPQLA
jgi:signal transduction histidine kinase